MNVLTTTERLMDKAISKILKVSEGEIILSVQNVTWGLWVLIHSDKELPSYDAMRAIMPLPIWGSLSLSCGIGIMLSRLVMNTHDDKRMAGKFNSAFLWISSWWWLSVAMTFARLNIYSTAVVTYPTFAIAAIVVLFNRRKPNA